jgi:hypothetical protein
MIPSITSVNVVLLQNGCLNKNVVLTVSGGGGDNHCLNDKVVGKQQM